MNCRELSNFLADYVAGDLAQPTQVELEAHLTRCRNCAVFRAAYAGTIVAGAHAFDRGVCETRSPTTW